MANIDKFTKIDAGMFIDRSDEKWWHPLLRNQTAVVASDTSIKDWYDPSVPVEERKAIVNAGVEPYIQFFMSQIDNDEARAQGDFVDYMVDEGCPEEPDAPAVRLFTRMPKNPEGKKLPVVMQIGGGALAYSIPECWCADAYKFSANNNAAVFSVRYRPSLEAEYPAAINDIHAAYAWIVKHADELSIDADNIVLQGNSSGAGLAMAACFRLKRYGFAPKGCVVNTPLVDERQGAWASRVYTKDAEWDGLASQMSAKQWLGRNFASPFIGPEAFANHATVDDCKGLCPMFIVTFEYDPGSDGLLELMGKFRQAGVFCEFHIFPGSGHSTPAAFSEDCMTYLAPVNDVVDRGVHDCLTYDLRRPWTAE